MALLWPTAVPLIAQGDSIRLIVRRSSVRCVDLYPSMVLLAWSLARSDEIDLSAIAVKREILQFVIAYCSIDL